MSVSDASRQNTATKAGRQNTASEAGAQNAASETGEHNTESEADTQNTASEAGTQNSASEAGGQNAASSLVDRTYSVIQISQFRYQIYRKVKSLLRKLSEKARRKIFSLPVEVLLCPLTVSEPTPL